jgi:DNA-binding beta-propeller fold protein YncE
VAVDTAGNLYVTPFDIGPVLKLAAGASGPITLPFTDLARPDSVAVDTEGNVYVADNDNGRVLTLSAR